MRETNLVTVGAVALGLFLLIMVVKSIPAIQIPVPK